MLPAIPYRHFITASAVLMILFLSSACRQEAEPTEQPPDTEDSIPDFVNTNYIELDSVQRISKFRSGVGHDYSDDFEYCRSMKHYFLVPEGTPLYAPVTGTITFLLSEWAGYKVQIRAAAHPDYYFEIFHVNLAQPFSTGDTVTEGQLLGTHAFAGTFSDITVAMQTTEDGPKENNGPPGMGVRYISYFQVITATLFEKFRQRGITNRNTFIITKEQRDADSLDCTTPWSGDVGNINNWVELNP